ncbi:MAG TPA: cytochrome P450 [Pseudonocardiaceae bacterium]|jgi:cytochrome P450|nr:cytochrome P450 [Pseudonocardiaceae bacterium]
MTEFAETDFFKDPAVGQDPYPYFEQLRARCPVFQESHHDVVMVTGWEEAVEIFHDADRFSSCISVTGPFPGFPVPLEGDDVSDQIEAHRDKLPFNDQLPTLDPPAHTDHRALLMRLITPKRLKENEDAMWQLADRQLDEFLTGGRGELIGGFATPFTLLVIADLLGMPPEDRDEFAATVQGGHQAGGGIGGMSDQGLALNPLEFLYERFSGYIQERRRNPSGGVLTEMAQARFPDGSVPTALEVAKVAANVFSAGQETTVRLLGSAFRILAEDPELQAGLRADRSRITNFIEETLRLESPIKGDFRLSKVPVTIGGVDLPAGTTVMVLNGAANRDPRQFDDPAVFDAARQNARRHISFGRGNHTCPGAPLARAEAKVAVERILARTTDIRIAEDRHGPAHDRRYHYLPTFILRGLTQLNLEFDLRDAAR